MIDITGTDMRAFIKGVYELSVPVGMGHLHYKPGPIDSRMLDVLMERFNETGTVHMDYVCGRCCKMNVWTRDGKVIIPSTWYDHSEDDFERLLSLPGVVIVNNALS